MPLYFCCKCRELITADFQADPEAFVCEKCKKRKRLEEGRLPSSKTTENKEMEICAVSEWEIKSPKRRGRS